MMSEEMQARISALSSDDLDELETFLENLLAAKTEDK